MIIQAFLIGLQRYEKAGNYKRCVFVYIAGVLFFFFIYRMAFNGFGKDIVLYFV